MEDFRTKIAISLQESCEEMQSPEEVAKVTALMIEGQAEQIATESNGEVVEAIAKCKSAVLTAINNYHSRNMSTEEIITIITNVIDREFQQAIRSDNVRSKPKQTIKDIDPEQLATIDQLFQELAKLRLSNSRIIIAG